MQEDVKPSLRRTTRVAVLERTSSPSLTLHKAGHVVPLPTALPAPGLSTQTGVLPQLSDDPVHEHPVRVRDGGRERELEARVATGGGLRHADLPARGERRRCRGGGGHKPPRRGEDAAANTGAPSTSTFYRHRCGSGGGGERGRGRSRDEGWDRSAAVLESDWERGRRRTGRRWRGGAARADFGRCARDGNS